MKRTKHFWHKWQFWSVASLFGLLYLTLIVAMIVADLSFTSLSDIRDSLNDHRVQYSIWLSLTSCTISAILSLWVAVPTGFILSRLDQEFVSQRFARRPITRRILLFLRQSVETIFDIPIVLPPLVVGISLLVLFQTPAGKWLDGAVHDCFVMLGFHGIAGITYEIPAIILAQFTVAAAFAIRTMKNVFDQIDPRAERVALTLGASHYQAFSQVTFPQSWHGVVSAFTLSWARSLGEFGPILIFAGTTRLKTEVLSTTVYLNFQMGNLRGAVAASLILLTLAGFVLIATKLVTAKKREPRLESNRD